MPDDFDNELKELMEAFEVCDSVYPSFKEWIADKDRELFNRARKLIYSSQDRPYTWWLLFAAHLGDGDYDPATDRWLSPKWEDNYPHSETIADLFYNFSFQICPPPCVETYRVMIEAWKGRTEWMRQKAQRST